MKDIRKYTDKVLNLAIIVLFIIMFGVTTLNVILRYIFNSPLSFSVELGRYTFCAIVYLGSILVMREDGHIGLDIIVDALNNYSSTFYACFLAQCEEETQSRTTTKRSVFLCL